MLDLDKLEGEILRYAPLMPLFNDIGYPLALSALAVKAVPLLIAELRVAREELEALRATV